MFWGLVSIDLEIADIHINFLPTGKADYKSILQTITLRLLQFLNHSEDQLTVTSHYM